MRRERSCSSGPVAEPASIAPGRVQPPSRECSTASVGSAAARPVERGPASNSASSGAPSRGQAASTARRRHCVALTAAASATSSLAGRATPNPATAKAAAGPHSCGRASLSALSVGITLSQRELGFRVNQSAPKGPRARRCRDQDCHPPQPNSQKQGDVGLAAPSLKGKVMARAHTHSTPAWLSTVREKAATTRKATQTGPPFLTSKSPS